MNTMPTIPSNIYLGNNIKRSRFRSLCALLLLSTFLLFSFPAVTFADKIFNVTLISSSNSGPYISTARSIEKELSRHNRKSIQVNSLSIEDLYTLKRSISEKSDLYVPIGQRALKEILKYSGDTPVLASLISKSDFLNISNNDVITKKHLKIGAVYIDQPLKRHLLFSQLVLPNIGQPGFILSSNNRKTIDDLNSLRNNKIYHIGILNPGDNVISTLSRILDDADAIIALPDPNVFNLRTTRNILLSTYRKRTPVIGFSKSYAKAGALAAIYSTPELIGKQTGEQITRLSKTLMSEGSAISLPKTSAKYFSISVNNKVSRSLGFPFLNAARLEKDLLRIEGSAHE